MEISNFSEYTEWASNNFFLTEVIVLGIVLFVIILTIALNAVGFMLQEWM